MRDRRRRSRPARSRSRGAQVDRVAEDRARGAPARNGLVDIQGNPGASGKQPGPPSRSRAVVPQRWVCTGQSGGWARGQRAGQVQFHRRRGRREARRDGVAEPAAPVPAADQGTAVLCRLNRVDQHRGGRVPAHHHFAAHRPKTAPLRLGEIGIDRGRVDRTEAGRTGRAVAHLSLEERAGHGSRMVGVGEPGLFREGEAVQPIDQVGAPRGHHTDLRVMHMRIDKAWRNQSAGRAHACPRMGGDHPVGRTGIGDQAITDRDRAIALVDQAPAGKG